VGLSLEVEKAIREVGEELRGELILSTRSLTQEDLDAHASEGPSNPIPIAKRMRSAHHAIARMQAAGLKRPEIAARVGYTTMALSHMQRNPAFQELVAYYSEKADIAAFDFTERIFFASMDTLDVLHDRVLTAGDQIPAKELRNIFVDLADRAGYAPVKRSEKVNFHVGLTKEELEEVKRASAGTGGSPEPTNGRVAKASAPDRGTPVGGAERRGAVLLLAEVAGGKASG
jgi:hypothetical protein